MVRTYSLKFVVNRTYVCRPLQECVWDGGDCCEETCIDTSIHDCGSNGYYCLDSDQTTTSIPECADIGSGNVIGNGLCNVENNNEVSHSATEVKKNPWETTPPDTKMA